MVTQEQVAEKIIEEVTRLNDEFGWDIAMAFLAGIKWAAELKDTVNTGQMTAYLGEFYSSMQKGEIS
jgi:hypothetical protein